MKDRQQSEEIVISGISGRFPQSDSVHEFITNLMEHHDLVTSNSHRFTVGLHGLPKGFGTLKEINRFDADFFGFLPKQVEATDPQLRIGLETTYEAMFDAGVNPADERGSRTGVFTAIIGHDAVDLWSRKPDKMDGANLIGSLGTMIPNRISYCFDFNGPSASYDTACSTSIFALEAAVAAIQSGACDSAVVMGACLVLDPSQSVMRYQAGMLARDCLPKTFDSEATGYVRAEAVATIYLQKKSVAKRAYASVVGIGTNTDGYKERGIFFPSSTMQGKLIEEVYLSAGIDPADVTYLEAHGTGTPAGDPEEIKAISRHFCLNKDRKSPLLIGSVKSNMGHAEGASGLCAIAKIVGILQSGMIPANLHYNQPHYSMKNIRDGKLKVINKNTEWNEGYIAINNFGFGGVNTHVILKPILAPNSNGFTNGNGHHTDDHGVLQELIMLGGRTQEGVEKNLKHLTDRVNNDQLYLLNEVNRSSTKGKFRGYAVTVAGVTDTQAAPSEKPPLWFVMNGMGSQWIGMGRGLFKFPAFKSAFEQCCSALLEYNYDLDAVYFSQDPAIFESPTNAFACIGATQIGLIDVLRQLGIKPDGLVGHSLGEALCAYADGCVTLKESIVTIYMRGKPCEDYLSTQKGSFGMAAVSLSAEATATICPEGLTVACHNSDGSTTVSGPMELIDQLKSANATTGIKVTEVNSCGMAFHSSHVTPAADAYLKMIKPILKNRARSTGWFSTSVPAEKWEEPNSKVFGPEYLYNNFLSPVLFKQALEHIPPGAVIVEVGASGLLRGLIQKGTQDATVIPLQARNTDCVTSLLTALGRLFVAGINFDLNKLTNQEPRLPLPGNTPLLGHLVDWDHSQAWNVPMYGQEVGDGSSKYDFCLARKEDEYLSGHMIAGRVLFPAGAYIYLAWKHFAASMQLDTEDAPVVLEDVKFLRATVIRSSDTTEFHVSILPGSGAFEIREGNTAVCIGKIRTPGNAMHEEKTQEHRWREIETSGLSSLKNFEETQTSDDIYKRLRFLGYEYSGEFKAIQKVDPSGTNFLLGFKSNWVSFIDTMLQTTFRIYGAEGYPTDLSVPTEVSKILIQPGKLREHIVMDTGSAQVFVNYDPLTHIIKCDGVEVEGLKMTKLSHSVHDEFPTVISHHGFDPYMYESGEQWKNDRFSHVLLCAAIVMENFGTTQRRGQQPTIFEFCTKVQRCETVQMANLIRSDFNTPEIDYTLCADLLSEGIKKSLAQSNVKFIHPGEIASLWDYIQKRYDLIVIDEMILIRKVISGLRKGGFLILKSVRGTITREELEQRIESDDAKYHIIAHKISFDYDIFLIRRDTKKKCKDIEVISIDSSTTWVDKLSKTMIRYEQLVEADVPLPRLYLVSTGKDAVDSGVLGLTLCLRKEPFTHSVRCIYSADPMELNFDQPSALLQEILDKDMVFNMIDQSGRLGCLIHSVISTKDATATTSSAYLGIESFGDLSSLTWNEGIQLDTLPKLPGLVPVHVSAFGLNFKDLMICTGNLATELKTEFPHCYQTPIGFEFSGTTANGRRVFGICAAQGMATQVLASEELLWDIPQGWSFEEAATVPVAYATAYFALVVRGQLVEGESVLIHLGLGSVGIAAIRIALSYNCQIFTTVGSDRKVKRMREMFPEIPSGNIGCSRDSRFEQMVRTGTQGRGVDLVLNATAGDLLRASVRCLAQHGRFLEIGRVDLAKNSNLGLDIFLRDATFHGIQLDLMLREGRSDLRKSLLTHVHNGIASGVVRPIPYRVYLKQQLEPAFRYMGQGLHSGKVVISLRRSEDGGNVSVSAKRKVYFNPCKSYVILGGLGGVGLEFINWMTLRNARYIVITSRTGKLTPYSRNYIKIWRERGVDVQVIAKNAVREEDAREILNYAGQLAPIAGIFNLTLHLDIKLMKHQTAQSFQEVMDPKITITRNLDKVSRELCHDLDHFVLFSSISSAVGFDGQTNYGFANSGAERLIEQRVRDGLAGRAIQWGPIGEVGAWHEAYNKDFSRVHFQGVAVQSISAALEALDLLFTIPGPAVTFCRKVYCEESSLEAALHRDDFNLTDRIARILGHTSASKLNKKHKLVDLGMDSIMSMEVTHVLKADFGLELSAGEIRGYTLEQLNEMSNHNRNESATVSAEMPKMKMATAGLVQLNFLKSITKSRFHHTEILYPINQMALDGVKEPGLATVLVCNSLEGPDVLRVLGSLTKAPCYSLQMSSQNTTATSILDTVDEFIGALERANVKGPYIVAGLSAGVFAAYEMSVRFQKMKQMIKLIWLDMTFDRLSAIVSENFGGATSIDEISDDELLVFVTSQFFGFDKTLLEKIMREETTFEGKMDRLLEIFQSVCEGELDEEGFRKFAISDWRSMGRLMKDYVPKEKFTEKTVLVKTTQNLIAYDISEYWGLEKICTQVPEVIVVDTTHSYLIAEPAVRDVVELINDCVHVGGELPTTDNTEQ